MCFAARLLSPMTVAPDVEEDPDGAVELLRPSVHEPRGGTTGICDLEVVRVGRGFVLENGRESQP